MFDLFGKSKSEPLQFNWQETQTGMRFTAPLDSLSVTEYAENLTANAYHAQAQWVLLKELLDNGQAEFSDSEIFMPCEEVCRLDFVEQSLLGLPEPYPFDLEIGSRGTLNEPEFRYNYQFLQPDRKPLHPERIGCVLRLTAEWAYLLTGEQFSLLEELDAFNKQEAHDKNFEANLLKFATIKGLATQTGAALDRYLNQENVVAPRTVRLRLREAGDGIEIIPDVDGVDGAKFEEVFDKFPNPEAVYNISQPEGARTRVLFRKEQREALDSVKRFRRVSREELDKIAKQPQAYFNPDIVELDPTTDEPLSFSDRVRAIGVYQPKVYPFISPYKSEWIPGIIVEDKDGKRTKIPVKDQRELDELKGLIDRANRTGKKMVTWKDGQLPVSEVERYLPFIEKQLKRRKKPPCPDEKLEPPVLIIEENIEDPGYVQPTPDPPVKEPFRHLLEPSPNLKQGVELLAHQEEGVAWTQQLWEKKYPGGLLADDMGLGKTLQVLCFLEWHNTKYRSQQPYLIVAPIVLLENWQAEYPKFFDGGTLDFITLYGNGLQAFKREINHEIPEFEGAERIPELRRRRGALEVDRLRTAKLVLTTYETVRDFQLDLGLIPWAAVVIDEAQRIKTPGALVTNAVKALKTDFRLALTGTPVENSLMDLWCITDFVAPGYLDSAKNFDRDFCRPLKHPDTDIRALGDQIRQRIGVHFKRRLKTDILQDLPEKHIHVQECQLEMPSNQGDRYVATLQSVHESESTGPESPNSILRVLHQLRDISDHPLLADSQWEEVPTPDLIEQSAKLLVTVKLLKKIADDGEKVILFAERRKTQHLLKRVIQERFGLANISIVNGDTPGSAQRGNSMKMSRQQAVNRFQAIPGFNAIIMSPLAAGVGLNITEANHVIHYSRWWNPAKEDQASDRVYRIGQTRPVHIYLPMATHPKFPTFDVVLHELLERKRQLSQGTLFPTEQAEVTRTEILDELRRTQPQAQSGPPLTIEDADALDPEFFEAFVAALFQAQGYRVELTPYSGDKGADVIAYQNEEETSGLLIQVKQRKEGGKPGDDAVDEIIAAKTFYEKTCDATFQPVIVTNREFTKQTRQHAAANHVTMYERKWLKRSLKQHLVTWREVNLCQFQTC